MKSNSWKPGEIQKNNKTKTTTTKKSQPTSRQAREDELAEARTQQDHTIKNHNTMKSNNPTAEQPEGMSWLVQFIKIIIIVIIIIVILSTIRNIIIINIIIIISIISLIIIMIIIIVVVINCF